MSTITIDDVAIDDEFEALCPDLDDAERAQLLQNIQRDGFRDPLVVWERQNILVDGHNRFDLWHLEFSGRDVAPPEIVAMPFEDRQTARNWIIDNQLGRRNLTPEQRTYLIGRKYNALKRDDGGHGDQRSGGQNGRPNAAGQIAEQYGISERSARRAGTFSNDVDAIGQNVGASAKEAILKGRSGLTQQQVHKVAGESPDNQPAAYATAGSKTGRRDIWDRLRAETTLRRAVRRLVPACPAAEVDWLAQTLRSLADELITNGQTETTRLDAGQLKGA